MHQENPTKKETAQSISLWISITTMIVTVVVGGLTIYFSYRSIKTQDLSLPKVQFLDIRRVTQNEHSINDSDLYGIECISAIRIANIGGASTFLDSAIVNIHIGSQTDSSEIDNIYQETGVSSQWGDISLEARVVSDEYPIKVPLHDTTEIHVLQDVVVSREIYSLVNPTQFWISPDYSDDLEHEIWIDYVLYFPDTEPVKTEPIFCVKITKLE